MISIDFWQEILHTITSNKLRTLLTGFSVAWGMFILIVMIGAGNGFKNGMEAQFARGAVNNVWITGYSTSRPYKGLPEGRAIMFHNDDYDTLKNFEGIIAITGRLDADHLEDKSIMQYRKNYGVFELCSCHPDEDTVKQTSIEAGRFINRIDVDQFRKTVAISSVVRDALFKSVDPIGKYISIRGVPFEVIGVFRHAIEGNTRRIYMPITTRQRVFGGGDRIKNFGILLSDMNIDQLKTWESRIRKYFAVKYKFDPQDMRALFVNNNFKEYKRFMNLFSTISTVVWGIGIMTIIAGMMGVSNIMVIAVKERTHEIGIRKALGATPGSIVIQVISEAVLITGVAGFSGMSMGVLLLDFATKNISTFDYFKNPEVSAWIMLSAVAVIVISGALAGLAPALHAARIRPIVALRDE